MHKLTHASSARGADMGRPNVLPETNSFPIHVALYKLAWIDGDYDAGGAYWGNVPESGFSIYWATDGMASVFVRARSEDEAKGDVLELLPNATFSPLLVYQEYGNTMQPFVADYLTAALWYSTGEDGEPLDKSCTIADLAPETIARAEADCARFQAENLATLALADLKEGHAGHCFWLSRCGHGSGFFDEYNGCTDDIIDDVSACNCPYHACQRLQDAAQKFGNLDLYKGDDGKLYFL